VVRNRSGKEADRCFPSLATGQRSTDLTRNPQRNRYLWVLIPH
jgi:hypothetical protein